MDNQINNDLLNFLPYDISKINEKSKIITPITPFSLKNGTLFQ